MPTRTDSRDEYEPSTSQTKGFWLAVAAILIIAAICLSFGVFEELDAGEVMVIQSPTGGLAVYNTPGPKPQWFGKVTKYRIRDQFWFDPAKEQSSKPIPIRFNDGGHADLFGSIAWEIPIDEKSVLEIHQKYQTHDSLENQLVRPVVEKALYMTGPLMSSSDSYAARRPELIGFISDQISRGIYRTEAIDQQVEDAATGSKKTIKVVRLLKGPNDAFLREERSPLDDFHIKVFNLSVSQVRYDQTVETQIAQQQKVTAEAQQQQIMAKTAQQKALTAEQEGRAEAMKEEWSAKAVAAKTIAQSEAALTIAAIEAMKAQTNLIIEADSKYKVAELALRTEVINAMRSQTNLVIAAESQLKVAKLAAEEAEQFKLSETAKGEGEASRRKAILQADGALEKKLQTYENVQRFWAESFSKFKGPLVPSIVVGSGQSNSGSTAAGASGVSDLIQLLSAKAAKDLMLDPTISQGSGTNKPGL